MIPHKISALGRLAATVVAVASLMAGGCNKPDAESAEQASAATIPAPPPVMPDGGPYTLRFFSAVSGELVTVKKPADVPEGARKQVLVTYEDPALQGPWVYVADLSGSADAAKGYAVTSVDRAELESQVAAAKPTPAPAGTGTAAAAGTAPQTAGAAATDNDVIIYRTSWCGYCKKAAEYLKLKGVPFVEKDLERDPGARSDMLARAQKAGVPQSQLQGVPIMAVKGKVFPGFDRGAIDRALAGR
jgi:glutaredoxin